MKRILIIGAVFAIIALNCSCSIIQSKGPNEDTNEIHDTNQEGIGMDISMDISIDISISYLTGMGGRLDLSKDDVAVFDSKGVDGYYDVYIQDLDSIRSINSIGSLDSIQNSDGTGRRCLTCGKAQLPQKHNGQPAWHPSGEYIVLQSVDPELKGLPQIFSGQETVLTGPGAGVNNNLWLMDVDGTRFYQLTHVADKKGVLHPHFTHDGKRIVWAELVDQTVKPSGKWVIRIADVRISSDEARDEAVLENIITLTPGNLQFYETHGFSPDDGTLLFSASPNGDYAELDIYDYDMESQLLTRLTEPDHEWDEHAQYSPDGQKIVWMSSKGIPQKIDQYKVKTDYWIMDKDGGNKERITFFNDPQSEDYIANGVACADSAWTADGNGILGYIIIREHQQDMNILIDFD